MNLLLYALVTVSGASILALEIVGTRVLGPTYGVNIFLWSALISVTLAALSVGYAIGGRWADRGPSLGKLASVFAAAGVWTVFIPLLKAPLIAIAEPMSLRAAVLFTSTVLFVPPLTLLGMISPHVIRLQAREIGHVGRTAGDLFAISTVASVLSALATGFWLIPYVGVNRMIVGIGAMLLAAAAASLLAHRSGRRSLAFATIALIAAASATQAPWSGVPEVPGQVFFHDSEYAEIRVVDRDDGRYLLLDGGVHTVLAHGGGESMHRYVPVMELAQMLFDEPGEMLLVGLGGGVIARDWHAAGWRVDAVEIDPVVVHAAREYFGLEPDMATVHTLDGRRFLAATDRQWDVILVDAFGSSSIPFHLVTQEMFALLRARLRHDGVLAMNVETRSWDDPLGTIIANSIRPSFDDVLALPTAEPPNTLGNIVFLAGTVGTLDLDEERLPHPIDHLSDPTSHWRVVEMNHAWDNRFEPPVGRELFTDDRDRSQVLAEAVNRTARRELAKFFAGARPVY